MKIRVKYEIEQQHRLIALFFLWIMVLSCLTTQAQENTLSIKGAVYSDMGEGLPFASITLKTAKEDDKPFKGVFSNDTGSFELSGLPAGTYYFLVSMVGYKALEREIRLENDIALGKLVLATDATMLGEVTINAHPKVVERQADRFVMNVGGSTFQTSSVMEIFMAMPFMQVQGEQIVINGKRNILVLVDNVPVPGVTLKDVLNTMNGSDIDKIDFITNPSARYDASVDAVISIHTKRALAQGLTGRLNGTYSRGNYGRGNVGLNLTYRKKKWTVDGRYNFNRSDMMTTIEGTRYFSYRENSLAIGGPNSEFYDYRNHSAKVGVNYTINPKHRITFTGNLIRRIAPHSVMKGTNDFSAVMWGTRDSTLLRAHNRFVSSNVWNYSLNYIGKLDTLGKQVEFVATYTPINNRSETQMLYQEMYLPDGTLLNELPLIKNDNPGKAHVTILQSDFILPFANGFQVNTGFKLSLSRNNSETNQYQLVDGSWILLSDLTFFNRFYEDIIGSYAEVQRYFGQTFIKIGVRAENTDMGVREVYNRNFFNLFPNAMIQQEVGNRKVTLNYRKFISRPGFGQMMPFRTYLNEFELSEGNMHLQPRYSHQFTVNGELTTDLFLEIGYIQEKDLVMQLPRQEGEVTIYAPMNMDGSEWSANLSYSRQLAVWWDINGYARSFRYTYEGRLNADNVSESGYSYNFGISTTFRLPAKFTIDAIYNHYGRAGYGGWRDFSSNFSRLAVRKSFLKSRAQMVLAVNDLLKGQRYRSEMSAGNLYVYNVNYQDSRRVSLGITFNFGKTTVKAATDKKLGNEEVVNRAN